MKALIWLDTTGPEKFGHRTERMGLHPRRDHVLGFELYKPLEHPESLDSTITMVARHMGVTPRVAARTAFYTHRSSKTLSNLEYPPTVHKNNEVCELAQSCKRPRHAAEVQNIPGALLPLVRGLLDIGKQSPDPR